MKRMFDMHCHIIPDVDDGAKSLDESLAMIHEERRQGVTDIILTPHFRAGMFETPRDRVERHFAYLRHAAREHFPEIKLYLGCEFHSNMDMAEMLVSDPRFRMIGTDYILLEFSGAHSGEYIRERTYSLIARGYQPIIAHCERYRPIFTNIRFAGELVDMGAELQVNADTVTGRDGWSMKRFASRLMKEGLLTYVGSDAHNMRDRAVHIGEARAYIEKKADEAYARRLFEKNPQRIVDASRGNKEDF